MSRYHRENPDQPIQHDWLEGVEHVGFDKAAETTPPVSPCIHCGETPQVVFDPATSKWDCFHCCGDRMRGALDHNSPDDARNAWNKVNSL